MMNAETMDSVKQKHGVSGRLSDGFHLLPEWEITKNFTLGRNKFLFFKRNLKAELLKKISGNAGFEKYLIRSQEGRTLSCMDIKVYKDSVYIVNLEINTSEFALQTAEKLIEEAVITAGAGKDVFMNIISEQKYKYSIKKALKTLGFKASENQSGYEQKIFGETYKLGAANKDKAEK